MQKYGITPKFEFKSIIEYYAKWIREGKLPVNSDWNKDLKVKFTVQDPCQLVRKSLGDPIAEDLRFVVESVVGKENFIDMYPNKSNNFCCGGGGGTQQTDYKEQRAKFGKVKTDQIMATGADYCIAPCHNCHSQIHFLNEYFEGGWYTVHLWTLICLSLGILGPEEREYLGPKLKNVGL
jgi:Fe-S oxidoreductase